MITKRVAAFWGMIQKFIALAAECAWDDEKICKELLAISDIKSCDSIDPNTSRALRYKGYEWEWMQVHLFLMKHDIAGEFNFLADQIRKVANGLRRPHIHEDCGILPLY